MNNVTIKREHFVAMVEVAADFFGENHSTTKALRETLMSPHADAMERGVALIQALPTAHGEHILVHAISKLNEGARTLSWLMEKAKTPTGIPPGETKH